MWEAVLFGVLACSSLAIGGVVGSYWDAPERVTGVILAFASGTMVSALAFELFPEAVELGGVGPAGAGLLAGAATFVVANTWLDSRVAPPEAAREAAEEGPGPETPAEEEAAAAARGDAPDLPEELAGAALQQREKVQVAAAAVRGRPEHPRLPAVVRRRGGAGRPGRHPDAGGVRARPAVQRLRHLRRVLRGLRPGRHVAGRDGVSRSGPGGRRPGG